MLQPPGRREDGRERHRAEQQRKRQNKNWIWPGHAKNFRGRARAGQLKPAN
jgi:hypothetical protein